MDSITEMNYITALEILWESQRQRGNIGKQDTAGERERERERERAKSDIEDKLAFCDKTEVSPD